MAILTADQLRERARARAAVWKAVGSGAVAVPGACEACGASGDLEAHHHQGYTAEHAIDVRWLCGPCHRQAHRRSVDPSMADRDFRSLRLLTGLSQREVERKLGWKRGWMSLIEHGRREPQKEAELMAFLRRTIAESL